MATCVSCVPALAMPDDCLKNIAGGNLATFFYAPECYLTTTGLVDGYGTGTITDIDMEAGKVFYKVSVIKDSLTISTVSEPVGNRWQTTLTAKLSATGPDADKVERSREMRELLTALGQYTGRLTLIWTDRDNVRHVQTGFERGEFTGESGATKEDVPGTTIVFVAMSDVPPYPIDSAFTIPV
jgi:hypothetical protein